MSMLNRVNELIKTVKTLKVKDIFDIINAYGAFTLDEIFGMEEEKRKIYLSRANICLNCDLKTENRCSIEKKGICVVDFKYKQEYRKKGRKYNGCGCSLNVKQSEPSQKCPLGKWENITELSAN